MKKVSVLGAGSWGTALAMVLSENSEKVVLWTLSKEQCEEINNEKTNLKYLKDVETEYLLWDGVHPTVAGHGIIARQWYDTVDKSGMFE